MDCMRFKLEKQSNLQGVALNIENENVVIIVLGKETGYQTIPFESTLSICNSRQNTIYVGCFRLTWIELLL